MTMLIERKIGGIYGSWIESYYKNVFFFDYQIDNISRARLCSCMHHIT